MFGTFRRPIREGAFSRTFSPDRKSTLKPNIASPFFFRANFAKNPYARVYVHPGLTGRAVPISGPKHVLSKTGIGFLGHFSDFPILPILSILANLVLPNFRNFVPNAAWRPCRRRFLNIYASLYRITVFAPPGRIAAFFSKKLINSKNLQFAP